MMLSYSVKAPVEVTHIETQAGVRYWEDASINGIEDDDGKIFGRKGDAWCVRIRLADGYIEGWPADTEAYVHYKVCDDGLYWLTGPDGKRIARRDGYVPSDFLCHGDNGYGDYIIMAISADGFIKDYEAPEIDSAEWDPCK